MEFIYGQIDSKLLETQDTLFYGLTDESLLDISDFSAFTSVDDIEDLIKQGLFAPYLSTSSSTTELGLGFTLALLSDPKYMTLIHPLDSLLVIGIYNETFNVSNTWNNVIKSINGRTYVIWQSANKLAPGNTTYITFYVKKLN